MSEATEWGIEYRVEKCFAGELTARIAGENVLACRDVQDAVDPPYIAVQCSRAEETYQNNGVYYVDVSILVADFMDEVTGGEHNARVQKVKAALEAIPLPGLDESCALHVFGFSVPEAVQANDERETGNLFQLRVGCMKSEKGDGTVLHVPAKTEVET